MFSTIFVAALSLAACGKRASDAPPAPAPEPAPSQPAASADPDQISAKAATEFLERLENMLTSFAR